MENESEVSVWERHMDDGKAQGREGTVRNSRILPRMFPAGKST